MAPVPRWLYLLPFPLFSQLTRLQVLPRGRVGLLSRDIVVAFDPWSHGTVVAWHRCCVGTVITFATLLRGIVEAQCIAPLQQQRGQSNNAGNPVTEPTDNADQPVTGQTGNGTNQKRGPTGNVAIR